MKYKDMYMKRIDYGPFTWVQGTRHLQEQRQYPDYGEWSEQMRAQKLRDKYNAFFEKRPKAAALLVELFGDSAFKVFSDFKFDKISETQCIELLAILRPIEDGEDEDRGVVAISNHIPLGNIT